MNLRINPGSLLFVFLLLFPFSLLMADTEPNDAFGTAEVYADGSGDLTTASDETDVYTITTTATGDVITIEVDQTGADVQIALHNSLGVYIDGMDSSLTGVESVSFLDNGSTYYIVVSLAGTDGTYDISAVTAAVDSYEFDDLPENSSILTAGSSQTHDISPTDTDYIKFYATVGNEYVVDVADVSGSPDVSVTLYDTDGSSVYWMEDYSTPTAETFTFISAKTGYYYIAIDSPDTGTYSISLTETDPGVADNFDLNNKDYSQTTTNNSITFAAPQVHTFHAGVYSAGFDASSTDPPWFGNYYPYPVAYSSYFLPFDNDYIRIPVTVGNEYTIDIDASLIGSSDADPDIYVYDSSGNVLYEAKNNGTTETLTFAAGSTEILFARIIDFEGTVTSYFGGTYSVTVTEALYTPPGGDAWDGDDDLRTTTTNEPTLLSTQTHRFAFLGDNDWGKITTIQGNEYAIDIPFASLGANVFPQITLYDGSGQEMLTVDASFGATLTFTAPSSGIYFFKIWDEYDAGGSTIDYNYDLTISDNGASTAVFDVYDNPPARDESLAITTNTISADGTVQSHNFYGDLDVDVTKVSLEKSKWYHLLVTDSGTSNDCSIGLYDPAKVLIGFSSLTGGCNLNYAFVAEETGTYYLQIQNDTIGVVSTDFYDLSVTDLNYDAFEEDDLAATASTIEVDGLPQYHTIDAAPPEEDWMRFYAESGTDYYVEVYNLGDPAMEVTVEVYEDDGTTLLGSSSSSVAGGSTGVLVTGADMNYRVKVIETNSAFGVGFDYKVRVSSPVPDEYEDNNTSPVASVIFPNGVSQTHSFYQPGDEDWIEFNGVVGNEYTVDISSVNTNVDMVLEVFESDGTTSVSGSIDVNATGSGETYTFTAPTTGKYYIYLTESSVAGGPGYTYDITLTEIAAPASPPGVISRWLLDGSAIDIVAGNNGSTPSGVPSSVQDKTGSNATAMQFTSASTDYYEMAEINNAGAGFSEVSVSFWLNTSYYDSGNADTGYIVGQDAAGNNTGDFAVAIYQENIWVHREDGGATTCTADNWVTGTGNVNDGEWHHVVVTVASSGDTSIYVDGVLDTTEACTDTTTAPVMATSGTTFKIGDPASASHLTGTLDDVQLYNYALTVNGVAVASGVKRWDGGGDGTSWSGALNWAPDGIPAGEDVILDHAYVAGSYSITLSAAANTGNFIIDSAGATDISVDLADNSLTVNNHFDLIDGKISTATDVGKVILAGTSTGPFRFNQSATSTLDPSVELNASGKEYQLENNTTIGFDLILTAGTLNTSNDGGTTSYTIDTGDDFTLDGAVFTANASTVSVYGDITRISVIGSMNRGTSNFVKYGSGAISGIDFSDFSFYDISFAQNAVDTIDIGTTSYFAWHEVTLGDGTVTGTLGMTINASAASPPVVFAGATTVDTVSLRYSATGIEIPNGDLSNVTDMNVYGDSGTTAALSSAITGCQNLTFYSTGASPIIIPVFDIQADITCAGDISVGKATDYQAGLTLSTQTLTSANFSIVDTVSYVNFSGAGNIQVTGNFNNSSASASLVFADLTLNGVGAQAITGSSTFSNLTFSDTALRTITLEAGQTQTVSGVFTAQPTAGSEITIDSSTAGTAAILTVTGSSAANGNLLVQDITSNSGNTIVALTATDNGNNKGWQFSNIWYARTNAGWSGIASWNTGGCTPNSWAPTLPGATTDVEICNGVAMTLAANEAVNSITIQSGGSLDAASYIFTVNGDWDNQGTFTPNTSTVSFAGTVGQTISGNTTFNNLTLADTGARVITFPASGTQTVNGAFTADGSGTGVISLRSSSAGTTYTLDMASAGTLSDLDVQDSIVAGAVSTPLNPAGASVDSGNNTGWFGATPAVVYSNATGNYSTPATWVTDGCGGSTAATGAPGTTTDVTICDGTTVTLDANAQMQSLTIGSDTAVADAILDTAGYTLTVTGNVTIGDGDSSFVGQATLAAGSSNIVVGGNWTRNATDGVFTRNQDQITEFNGTSNVAGMQDDVNATFAYVYVTGGLTAAGTGLWAKDGIEINAGTLTVDAPVTAMIQTGSSATTPLALGGTSVSGTDTLTLVCNKSNADVIEAGTYNTDVIVESDSSTGALPQCNLAGNVIISGNLTLQSHTASRYGKLDTAIYNLTATDITLGDGSTKGGYLSISDSATTVQSNGNFTVLNTTPNSVIDITAGLTPTIASYGDFIFNEAISAFQQANSTVSLRATTASSVTMNNASFYNLEIDASANTYTVGSSVLSVNNDLSIVEGTLDTGTATVLAVGNTLSIGDGAGSSALTANSTAISVSGDWTLNDTDGTFTAGNSTISLNAVSGTQNITGTNTFYTLMLADTGARTITFPQGVTTTVTNTFVANATLGNEITLESSDGTNSFTLDITGSLGTLNYLNVNHSIGVSSNAAVSLPLAPLSSVDGGTNVNWFSLAFFSIATGQYGTAGTWAHDGCSGSVTAAIAPDSTADVTICDGTTVTLGAVESAQNLQIGSGTGNATLDTAAFAFTVNGNLTLGNGVGGIATFNANGSAIDVAGSLTKDVDAVFDGTGGIYLTGTGNVTCGGTNSYPALVLDASGGYTLQDTLYAGDLTLGQGTLNNNDQDIVVDSLSSQAPGTTLNLSSSGTNTVTVYGDIDFSTGGATTVNYSGGGIIGYTVNGNVDFTNSTHSTAVPSLTLQGNGDSIADNFTIISAGNLVNDLTISATDSTDIYDMGDNLVVSNDLNITNGELNTTAASNFQLSVGNDVTVATSVAGEQAHLYTNGSTVNITGNLTIGNGSGDVLSSVFEAHAATAPVITVGGDAIVYLDGSDLQADGQAIMKSGIETSLLRLTGSGALQGFNDSSGTGGNDSSLSQLEMAQAGNTTTVVYEILTDQVTLNNGTLDGGVGTSLGILDSTCAGSTFTPGTGTISVEVLAYVSNCTGANWGRFPGRDYGDAIVFLSGPDTANVELLGDITTTTAFLVSGLSAADSINFQTNDYSVNAAGVFKLGSNTVRYNALYGDTLDSTVVADLGSSTIDTALFVVADGSTMNLTGTTSITARDNVNLSAATINGGSSSTFVLDSVLASQDFLAAGVAGTGFNNLSIVNSSGGNRDVVFSAGDIYTVAGDFSAAGTGAGAMLGLLSDTPGTAFSLNVDGSFNAANDYLSVTDSDASGSVVATPFYSVLGNNTDGGNTTGWFPPTYYSAGSGNFGVLASWTTTACGSGGAPASIDPTGRFTVCTGDTVTVAADQSTGALTVQGTLDISGGFTLTANDVLNIDAGAIVTATGDLVANADTTLNGDLTLSGSGTFTLLDHLAGTFTVDDGAAATIQDYSKTGATTVLIVGTAATATLTVNNSFTHTGGSISPFAGSTMDGTALNHTSALFYKGSFATSATPSSAVYYYELTDGTQPFEVEVVDPSANLDCTVADTLNFTLTTTGGESEAFTLTETGLATGIFQDSTLTFALTGVTTTNGIIEGARDDILTFTYTDPYDATDINTYQSLLTDYLMPTIVSRETSDGDSNGKIDSILMRLSYATAQSCSGLSVDVTGYSVRSYSSCSETDDFFIVHLDELSGNCTVEDTSACDTDSTPDVQLTASSFSLTDSAAVAATDTAPPALVGTNVDIGDFGMTLVYSEPVFALGGSAVSTADFQYHDFSFSGVSGIRSVTPNTNQVRIDTNAIFTFNDTKSDRLTIAQLQDALGNTTSSTDTDMVDPEFDPGIGINSAKVSDNYLDYRKTRSTVIGFNLSASGNVNIELLDLKGRKIRKLHNQRYSSGLQYYEWSPGNIRPGLYYLKVNADGWREPQIVRVMIIR